MTHLLTVIVIGQPAPQGSKRHVGKGVMVESSKAVKPWREAVKFAALDPECVVVGDGRTQPLPTTYTCPLRVVVTFTVPKPKSAPKTRRTVPAKRPDVDKLLRSTLDALTDAAVWADDGLIVDLTGRKTYPRVDVWADGLADSLSPDPDALTKPGALIRIYEVTP